MATRPHTMSPAARRDMRQDREEREERAARRPDPLEVTGPTSPRGDVVANADGSVTKARTRLDQLIPDESTLKRLQDHGYRIVHVDDEAMPVPAASLASDVSDDEFDQAANAVGSSSAKFRALPKPERRKVARAFFTDYQERAPRLAAAAQPSADAGAHRAAEE